MSRDDQPAVLAEAPISVLANAASIVIGLLLVAGGAWLGASVAMPHQASFGVSPYASTASASSVARTLRANSSFR